MTAEEHNAILAMDAGDAAAQCGDLAAAAAHYREAVAWYKRANFTTSDLSVALARIVAEGAEDDLRRAQMAAPVIA
jgi:hypothetical protein